MRLLILLLACCALQAQAQTQMQMAEPRSGLEFQSKDVRRMQQDDFANPAMLPVARGETLWRERRGAAAKSCADCHGDAARSMRGLAARLPAWDARLGRVSTLDARVNACVAGEQRAAELAPEAPELLGLLAYLALQSRGMPLQVDAGAAAVPLLARGRELYMTRVGQMNLACTHCHDSKWGSTLLAEKISQGHPNAWPAYRLEWQGTGSLERRLRACFLGVRAEMPAYRSEDLVALQLYLAVRARGMAMEAPGVRR